ncbi:MAG: HAMP domain-containing histidine kinase, partial [Lewinella sp.]|nr:HAMP domain-containing histidine kinase [Lewinella sp.]
TAFLRIQPVARPADSNTVFHFRSPGNDDLLMSVAFADLVPLTPEAPDLWPRFRSRLRLFVREQFAEAAIFFFSDQLGLIQENLQDTTRVDTALIDQVLTATLREQGIRSAVHLQLRSDTISAAPLPASQVRTQALPVFSYQDEPPRLVATLTHPAFDLLRRALFTILASAVVVMLTLLTFYLLFSTILRQKRLAELKDDFIDNITHELQTPIAALRMSVDSLARLKLPAEADRYQRYLGLARQELARLSGLIDRLLFRGWAEDQPAEEQTTMDWTAAISEQVRRWSTTTEKPVTIRWQPGRACLIRSAPHDPEVVLGNLLQNAVKYSDPTGVHITIVLEQRGVMAHLSVADDGWGILPADRQHLFEKFHRSSDRNRNYSVDGLGIGLYHVRQCVTGLGGQISVEPNTPRGTRFIIQLPRHDQDPAG